MNSSPARTPYPTSGDQPARQLDIPSALSEIECALNSAEKSLEQLGARLVSVSRPQPPDINNKDGHPEPVTCDLARAIRGFAQRVRFLDARISEQHERLEI
jgi:hypothetical protein